MCACAEMAEWTGKNRLCRWIAHSYLSRVIQTGRWVGECVRTEERCLLDRHEQVGKWVGIEL
jgi:hypothetical protein